MNGFVRLPGIVGKNQLQAPRLKCQLPALFPKRESQDVDEAEKGDGAAQQGADGYARIDGYAGAEGADHQVDQDADEDEDDALEQGFEGSLVGSHRDGLNVVDGGQAGIVPVFFLYEGNNAAVREGQEVVRFGGRLNETGGTVQKTDDLLVSEEAHLPDQIAPGPSALGVAGGSFVHGIYGITNELTFTLNEAMKMDEALLAYGGVAQGTPLPGEEFLFHFPGYAVGLEFGGRDKEIQRFVSQGRTPFETGVGVDEGQENVDGDIQGAGTANEGGAAGGGGYGEALQQGLEGTAAHPVDGGREQAAMGRPVEQGGGARYAATGMVGGADAEETPPAAVHDGARDEGVFQLVAESCGFEERFCYSERAFCIRDGEDGVHEGLVGDALGQLQEAGAVFAVAE